MCNAVKSVFNLIANQILKHDLRCKNNSDSKKYIQMKTANISLNMYVTNPILNRIRKYNWMISNAEMLQYLMVMGVVGYAQGSLEKLNSICNPYNSSQELTNCNYLNMTQKTLLRQFLIDSGPADDVLNVTLNVKNPIQELMAFPAIADLFTLFLRHNSIKKIGSAAFQRLMSLLQLDLSNNDLTDVDFMSGGIDLPLEALYLGHNRIRSVDQRAFDRLPRLKVLHLNNNPIVMMDDRFVTAISRLQNLQVTNAIPIPDNHLHPEELLGISFWEKKSEYSLYANPFLLFQFIH